MGIAVLVAVTDSPAAFKAAEVAVQYAGRFGATLHAVTVIEPGRLDVHLAGNGGLARREALAAEAALRYVAALGSSAGVEVSARRREGNVSAEILAEAEAIDADVIVMARVDRPGHAIPYVGGQTLRVLEFSPVPVLVVPIDRAR